MAMQSLYKLCLAGVVLLCGVDVLLAGCTAGGGHQAMLSPSQQAATGEEKRVMAADSPLLAALNRAVTMQQPHLPALTALLKASTAKAVVMQTINEQGYNLLDQTYLLYDGTEQPHFLALYDHLGATQAQHSDAFFQLMAVNCRRFVHDSADPTLRFHVNALHWQAQQVLLAWRYEPRSKTLLHLAAEKGQLAVGEVLLAAGADPNLLDAQGRTALDLVPSPGHRGGLAQVALSWLATVKDFYPFYHLLKKKGGQHGPYYRNQLFRGLVEKLQRNCDQDQGQLKTMIDDAMLRISKQDKTTLFDTPIDNRGFTLLHWAAQWGKTGLVLALMSCGANVRQRIQLPVERATGQETVEKNEAASTITQQPTPIDVALDNKQYETVNAVIQEDPTVTLPNTTTTQAAVVGGHIATTNAYIQQLLLTDDEANDYDTGPLYAALGQLPPGRLFGRDFAGGKTLLHELALDPNPSHTQGVAAYIAYLSEKSPAYQRDCVNGFSRGAFPRQTACPSDIAGLISCYLPSGLDTTDDAGRTPTDYAYEKKTYAYSLLQPYGGHHSGGVLVQRIRDHLAAGRPPYGEQEVAGWGQRVYWGERLFKSAVKKCDLNLVWLLLGYGKKYAGESASRCYRQKAEELVNGELNQRRYRLLKPGYSLLGYCSDCKEIIVDAKGFAPASRNGQAPRRKVLYSIMYTDVVCPSCGRGSEGVGRFKVQSLLLHRCNYSIRRGYKYCSSKVRTRIEEGVVQQEDVLWIDFLYESKNDGFFFYASPLPTDQQL